MVGRQSPLGGRYPLTAVPVEPAGAGSALRTRPPEELQLGRDAAVNAEHDDAPALPDCASRVVPSPEPSPGAARRAQRLAQPRLARELRTLRAMLRIHCRRRHGKDVADCEACRALERYAERRLAACPFGGDKPTCANCAVHCYAPAQREQVKAVMRYAGPRMLLRYPLLAVAHVLDGRRPAPPRPRNPRRG